MAASFPSLSSENEAKENPYQLNTVPGPKGAYEARYVNGGLYVRVGMPGVPPGGVKLVKYGDTTGKVTFTGKAPKHWGCDSSERVYGGYVLLDRDPTKLDAKMSLKNGCFRLFFPEAKGTLHFLPLRKNTVLNHSGEGSQQKKSVEDSVASGDSHKCCHSQFVESQEDTPGIDKMLLHSRSCPCRRESGNSSGAITLTQLNPFLLDGVEGVYEAKLVHSEFGERVYMRMDMPGLQENNCTVAMKSDTTLFYGGDGLKDNHLDEGGRSYLSSMEIQCNCCKIINVQHEMKHGVLRLLVKKFTIRGGSCSSSGYTSRA